VTEWDAYWQKMAQGGYINYTPELLSVVCSTMSLNDKRILEIGGGTGGNASWLAQKGADVHLLDFSWPALQISEKVLSQSDSKMKLVCADAYRIPYPDNYFDLIFHQGFLEHFQDPMPLILEQRRVLREEGYVLIDVPQRYNLYTVWKHLSMVLGRWEYGVWETEFSFGELRGFLERAGFTIVRAYAREYYPRGFYIVRHLYKVEENLFNNTQALSRRGWKMYNLLWERFERSWLGLHSLKCIGVLGQKVSSVRG
jgi:ubiquinone/menaquinone biosynthesis C-methylase UbiE